MAFIRLLPRTLAIPHLKMSFPYFAALPPELQAHIWESCIQGPSMHIFDVCFPSWRGLGRSARAFAGSSHPERFETYKKTVFLDALDTSAQEFARATRVTRHSYDPSMYCFAEALKATSRGAARAIACRGETNMVWLPGRDQKVIVPRDDVLLLRFGDGGAATQTAAQVLFSAESSSISDVLECEWSGSMASTLRRASKVALDVTETWVPWIHTDAALEEIEYLASTLQQGLEVLYLVDQCAGRCRGCSREDIEAQGLQVRDKLWETLHQGGEEEREGDVIQAVSKRYVEVFNLEQLGWEEDGPSYLFAKKIDKAIREQQQQHGEHKGTFKGVRVLVMQDESMEGVRTEVEVDCQIPGIIDSPMDLLNERNLMAFTDFVGSDELGLEEVEGRVFRMALSWEPEMPPLM